MEDTETYRECAGGIVIGDGGTLALVKSEHSQSWLFPKGVIESNEDIEEAARREISEETGLTDLEFIADLGEYVRPQRSVDDPQYTDGTRIHMFLFAAPAGAELAPTMEIEEARWVPYREVAEVLGTPHIEWFPKDRAWFATVFDRVREAIQRD